MYYHYNEIKQLWMTLYFMNVAFLNKKMKKNISQQF